MKRSAASTQKRSKQNGTFKSGYEQKVARSLDSLGAPVAYEQDKLKYTVPASKHTYTPDFTLSDGTFIESKGNLTPRDRKLLKLVKEQHPEVRVLILFQRDNYMSGKKVKKRKRYSDWAKENGFEYHVSSKGEVPKEWLE